MGSRQAVPLGLAMLASACVAPESAQPVRTHIPAPPPTPRYSPTGLEGVIGRTAKYLEAAFGKPVLDIREGSARKLQFAGAACVLDAYLYPPRGGGDPIVTYVDARRPDGTDFDRASCVAALERKRQ